MKKITIAQISRKQQPSKNRPGTTYTITNVKDTEGNVYSTFGRWAESWQEGQSIEANVTEKEIIGFDGFPKKVYNLENPIPQTGRFGPRNFWPQAYDLAVSVLVNSEEKPFSIERLDTLAVTLHKRLENGPQTEVSKPSIDPNEIQPEDIPF